VNSAIIGKLLPEYVTDLYYTGM